MLWRCRPRKPIVGLFRARTPRLNFNYRHQSSGPSPAAQPEAPGVESEETTQVPLTKEYGLRKTVFESRKYHAPTNRITHADLIHPNNDWLRQKTGDSYQQVRVTGLVRSIRKQKRIAFAHIQDGSTHAPLQATMDPSLAVNLSNGAYAELVGRWQPSPGKGQSWELQVESVENVGESIAEENPIQKQSMSPEYLRTIPHMRIRTPFSSLVTTARSHLICSATNFWISRPKPGSPATQVQPPIITSSDCEGAGEVFTISPQSYRPPPQSGSTYPSKDKPKLYFRDPKYLTVSSQLHLEAWSAELGDVWALSPTFRAEESDTSRHLAEFYMLEAEFRGVKHLQPVIEQAGSLIEHLTLSLADHGIGRELLALYADHKHRPVDWDSLNLEKRWTKLCSQPKWTQITYTDAIRELQKSQTAQKSSFQYSPTWESGLNLEHERWIVENIGMGFPTIVTHYPKAQKPFYMLPSSALDEPPSQDGDVVACFDILLPHGYAEVCGGSLREHRLPNLIEAMREKKLLRQAEKEEESNYPHLQPGESLGNLQWYADLRRFGSSPHGGFGLGFDRLLAYLTGAANVRDVVGFPRYWGRADC